MLPSALMLSALIAMSLATFVAVVTSYYFYRWRRIIAFEGKVVTVPEELIAQIAAFRADLKTVQSAVDNARSDQKKRADHFLQQIGKTDKVVEQLLETTLSLQSALDQRDAEIKRLQRGYDAELMRRFIGRFVRVKIVVADTESQSVFDRSSVHQIRRLLDDALDECGVEEFSPKIGEDFRTATGVADNPRIVETADANKNFQIADILEPGYRFRNFASDNIILPSRVSIYVVRHVGA